MMTSYLYRYRSTIRDESDVLIEPFASHAALRAVNAGDSLRDRDRAAPGRGTTANRPTVGGGAARQCQHGGQGLRRVGTLWYPRNQKRRGNVCQRPPSRRESAR